jgi:hypothetical protein
MTTMRSDQDKSRRGEPVLLNANQSGPPLLATIEWGNDQGGYSVCTEPGGARFQVQKNDITPDPGGSRPLWERRRAEDGETARVAAKAQVTSAEREVVEAAMAVMGFRGPSSTAHLDLHAACVALDKMEKRLKTVTIMGARHSTETP